MTSTTTESLPPNTLLSENSSESKAQVRKIDPRTKKLLKFASIAHQLRKKYACTYVDLTNDIEIFDDLFRDKQKDSFRDWSMQTAGKMLGIQKKTSMELLQKLQQLPQLSNQFSAIRQDLFICGSKIFKWNIADVERTPLTRKLKLDQIKRKNTNLIQIFVLVTVLILYFHFV
jgi:hypothetical protein